MISRAIVQSAIVLMNRRMKTEREVRTFVPVCSSVVGMHCIISKEGALRKPERALRRKRGCDFSTVLGYTDITQQRPKRADSASDLLRHRRWSWRRSFYRRRWSCRRRKYCAAKHLRLRLLLGLRP